MSLVAVAPAWAFSMQEIAPGLWVHVGEVDDFTADNQGDIANLTAIVGSDAVAVVDTGGSPEIGRSWREAIATVTSLPVRYVINTHFHPDHVMGNAAFEGDDTVFVGHHKLPRALADRLPHYEERLREIMGPEAISGALPLPTLLVEDRLEIDLGGRSLILRAWPTAHTSADLTIEDPQTKTLVAGDLVFRAHLPVIDGSINGWIDWQETLKAMGIEHIVPGHGAPGDWPEIIAPQANYLLELRDAIRAAIDDNVGLAEATDGIAVPAGADWQLTEIYHQRNVVTSYTELEWE